VERWKKGRCGKGGRDGRREGGRLGKGREREKEVREEGGRK